MYIEINVQLLSREYGSEAGMHSCPVFIQHLYGLDIRQSLNHSHCGPAAGKNRITDLAFADNAVILSESLGYAIALHEETKPLGLQVYRCMETC